MSDLPSPQSLVDAALQDAFVRETRRGVLRAAIARALLFSLLLVNHLSDLLWRNQPPFAWVRDLFVLIMLGTLVASVANYGLAARSKTPLRWSFVFMVLDLLVFAEVVFGWFWNPPIGDVPGYIAARTQDVMMLAVILGVYVLPLSRGLTLAAGAGAIAIWALGLGRAFAIHKGAILYLGPLGPSLGRGGLTRIMDPDILIADYAIIPLLLLALLTGLLVWSTSEGRRFVTARVRAEADAAFLERFFPPALGAEITASKGGSIAPARRRVAVLFADRSLGDGPATPDLTQLRAYYERLEVAVFAHDGVLDRFTGGPAMAVFGALAGDADPAAKALACARDLSSRFGATGERMAIALNAGEAVCGETGGEHGRVFSVVGDVVNTARRVLDVAKARGAVILATDLFMADAGSEAGPAIGLEDTAPTVLRGRETPVRLWTVSA